LKPNTMSSFTCPECGKNILEDKTGHYTTACTHYPIEEFTELSGKLMSDGAEQEDADVLAFALMKRERGELF